MLHHCQLAYNASLSVQRSDSSVPSVVGNSCHVSRELNKHNDCFLGSGRRLVSHWEVLSSPRDWEPELYLPLQVKWSVESKWQYSRQGAFACFLQEQKAVRVSLCLDNTMLIRISSRNQLKYGWRWVWWFELEVAHSPRCLNTWCPVGGAVWGESWPCWKTCVTGGQLWGLLWLKMWGLSSLLLLPCCDGNRLFSLWSHEPK